jgi:hypothetical protein
MNRFYPEVASRAGHRCEYCHAPEAIFNLSFEVDHIIPVSRSGPAAAPNLALACRACNLAKSAYVAALHPESQAEVRFYHPRIDVWAEHFVVNSNGEIVGLSDIGRATVQSLKLNDPSQRIARQHWLRLGLFP